MAIYSPSYTSRVDKLDVLKIAREHPFATLITPSESDPWISHLPLLLLEGAGGSLEIIGHMAKSNHHSDLMASRESTVIFHGPHVYISPRWYQIPDVPTWNYLVVHMRVRGALVATDKEILEILRLQSIEREGENGWQFQIPSDLEGRLSQAIVGFRFEVIEMQAKFKLGQRLKSEDRKGACRELRASGDRDGQKVADWMERYSGEK